MKHYLDRLVEIKRTIPVLESIAKGKLKREEKNAEKLLAKMKSNEWMVLNADSKQEVLKDLDKVIIKNIQDDQFR